MSLPISGIWFLVCAVKNSVENCDTANGTLPPLAPGIWRFGVPLFKMLAAAEEVGDRQLCVCMPLLKG